MRIRFMILTLAFTVLLTCSCDKDTVKRKLYGGATADDYKGKSTEATVEKYVYKIDNIELPDGYRLYTAVNPVIYHSDKLYLTCLPDSGNSLDIIILTYDTSGNLLETLDIYEKFGVTSRSSINIDQNGDMYFTGILQNKNKVFRISDGELSEVYDITEYIRNE